MKKIMAVALPIVLACGHAVASDNYVSIGAVKTKASAFGVDGSETGYGGTYSYVPDESNMGIIATIDYTSYSTGSISLGNNSVGAIDVSLTNTSIGLMIQPQDTKWFRIYPMAGLSFFSADTTVSNKYAYSAANETDTWFNAGAGIQLQIPNYPVFIDANYRKVFTSGKYKDIDISTMYFGVGYNF